MVKINFIDAHNNAIEVEVNEGDTIMEAATHNMVDGIVAECGGSMSCATCHCFIEQAVFDTMQPPTSLEQSMLDCLPEVKKNSRLSCQVPITKDLDGVTVTLPKNQL